MPRRRRLRQGRGHRAADPIPGAEIQMHPRKSWALFFYLCGDHDRLEEAIELNLKQLVNIGASPDAHVVIQRDRPYLHGGAERFVLPEQGATTLPDPTMYLDAVNTGSPESLLRFLRWAVSVCPSEHIALVIGGIGLFEPGSIAERGERPQLFSICDDQSSSAAMDIVQLRRVLQDFAKFRFADDPDGTRQRVVDVLAFDMCHMQFLEVAYELERVVRVLVASQTAVPPEGWNYDRVLGSLERLLADRSADADQSAPAVARVIVTEGAAGWPPPAASAEKDPPQAPRLSALNLENLSPLERAFDAVMLGMLAALGDDLVWWARDRVILYYLNRHPLRRVRTRSSADIVYDLGALMAMVSESMGDVSRRPYTYWLSHRLDAARRDGRWWLFEPVRAHLPQSIAEAAKGMTIDLGEIDACFRQPQKRRGKAGPPEPTLLEVLDRRDPPDFDDPANTDLLEASEAYKIAVEAALKHAVDRTRLQLRPSIQAELGRVPIEKASAQQIVRLADQVSAILRPVGGRHDVVLARTDGTLSGVSIYRPEHLEEVGDLNYLNLAFHDRIHWAAYLTASNLIAGQPRALWRLVSSMLSSSSSAARVEIMNRLVGPDAVAGELSNQLRTLEAPATLRLSLEPLQGDAEGAEGKQTAPSELNYQLRLDAGASGATIAQQRARVYEPALDKVLTRLDEILAMPAVGTEDFETLQGLGRSLGEDVLQDLVQRLEVERQRVQDGRRSRAVHLQLQIPDELMRYPWELMSDRDGWLGERFALGRQVFTDARMVRWTPGRRARALRILVIGEPAQPEKSNVPPLPGAQDEAQGVVDLIKEIGRAHPGLIDFDAKRDKYIGRTLTGERLRNLLRTYSYDIVHFAGHALFDPNDVQCSAWILSDGPLVALNIRNTLAWLKNPPSLVFANACGAAMDRKSSGDSLKDVSGLATAFINQGVAAYIAPLWPIDDAVAKGIAATFYQGVLRDRMTVGEALKQAKLAARADVIVKTAGGERAGFQLGMGWASLVLYGDPATTVTLGVGIAEASTESENSQEAASGETHETTRGEPTTPAATTSAPALKIDAPAPEEHPGPNGGTAPPS